MVLYFDRDQNPRHCYYGKMGDDRRKSKVFNEEFSQSTKYTIITMRMNVIVTNIIQHRPLN